MRAKITGYLDRAQVVANTYPASDQSLPARYARAISSFINGGLNSGMPQIEALIRDAVWRKELKHHVNEPGFIQPARTMSAIGG